MFRDVAPVQAPHIVTTDLTSSAPIQVEAVEEPVKWCIAFALLGIPVLKTIENLTSSTMGYRNTFLSKAGSLFENVNDVVSAKGCRFVVYSTAVSAIRT